jgi:hypothetical protein
VENGCEEMRGFIPCFGFIFYFISFIKTTLDYSAEPGKPGDEIDGMV